MSDGPVLLVTAAALAAVGTATVAHRRDQLGVASGSAVLVAALTVTLVGFSATVSTRSGAAQLQAFAVIVELLGALFVFALAALGIVLRRRTGSDLVVLARSATMMGAPEAAPRTAGREASESDPSLATADAQSAETEESSELDEPEDARPGAEA